MVTLKWKLLEVAGDDVYLVVEAGKSGRHRFFDEPQEELLGLLVVLTQDELLGQLVHFDTIKRNILFGVDDEVAVDHEVHEVEDDLGLLAETVEVGDTRLEEHAIVLAAFSAEDVEHFFPEFEGGLSPLGVFAHGKAEVDVEDLALVVDHQILQVTVTDTEQVRDDAVTGQTFDVVDHDFLVDLHDLL